ncbi:hypothetical protein C8R44DRAFT_887960 [Mycena epipterygia]|nr:hypothetical protein C8R44DRAFT_887960 [Mycena epipterygia]
MPCDAPFFPHHTNFQDANEHDVNPRKYWFLVLGVGLFTKKTDADGHCDPDDVLIYFTKEQAERRWATYCHRRHTHDDDDKVVLESDDSDDEAAHSLRSVSVPPVRSGAVQRGSAPVNTPMPRAASVKSAAATPRATSAKPSAKPSTPTKRREVILPLFLDDSPPSISTKPPVAVKRESVSVKQQVKQKPLLTILPDTTSPRKRSGTHICRLLTVSIAGALPMDVTRASLRNLNKRELGVVDLDGVVERRTEHWCCHRRTSRPASALGRGMLCWRSTRTLYKDVKKAVREMAIEETMQVVDCEDVVGYCAGKTGKMGE